MNNPSPPLTFEQKIHAATKARLPLPSLAFQVRLTQELFDQPMPKRTWQERFNMKSISPLRKFTIAVFVIFMLLGIIAGPQKVYAALRNLLRYIPGIGMVEPDATPRVLAEPLRYEQDGVVYLIEAFYADENETILTYRVEHLPAQANQDYIQKIMAENPTMLNPQGTYRNGTQVVKLILPDGRHLKAQHTNNTSPGLDRSVWAEQLRFDALPEDVSQLRILFVQIPGMAKGIAPENVQLELNLIRKSVV